MTTDNEAVALLAAAEAVERLKNKITLKDAVISYSTWSMMWRVETRGGPATLPYARKSKHERDNASCRICKAIGPWPHVYITGWKRRPFCRACCTRAEKLANEGSAVPLDVLRAMLRQRWESEQ